MEKNVLQIMKKAQRIVLKYEKIQCTGNLVSKGEEREYNKEDI